MESEAQLSRHFAELQALGISIDSSVLSGRNVRVRSFLRDLAARYQPREKLNNQLRHFQSLLDRYETSGRWEDLIALQELALKHRIAGDIFFAWQFSIGLRCGIDHLCSYPWFLFSYIAENYDKVSSDPLYRSKLRDACRADNKDADGTYFELFTLSKYISDGYHARLVDPSEYPGRKSPDIYVTSISDAYYVECRFMHPKEDARLVEMRLASLSGKLISRLEDPVYITLHVDEKRLNQEEAVITRITKFIHETTDSVSTLYEDGIIMVVDRRTEQFKCATDHLPNPVRPNRREWERAVREFIDINSFYASKLFENDGKYEGVFINTALIDADFYARSMKHCKNLLKDLPEKAIDNFPLIAEVGFRSSPLSAFDTQVLLDNLNEVSSTDLPGVTAINVCSIRPIVFDAEVIDFGSSFRI